MSIYIQYYTADDLWRLAHLPAYSAQRLELSEGILITLSPAGGKHGWIAHRFGLRVGTFVDAYDAGYVTAAETGYILHTGADGRDTVRAPDVGFVRRERLPQGLPDGYIPLAPDLAVEVVSPNDEAQAIEAKLNDYLRYGVRLIVFCYPRTRTFHVYSGNEHRVLNEDEVLDCDPVLPGLKISVGDVFGST